MDLQSDDPSSVSSEVYMCDIGDIYKDIWPDIFYYISRES